MSLYMLTKPKQRCVVQIRPFMETELMTVVVLNQQDSVTCHATRTPEKRPEGCNNPDT